MDRPPIEGVVDRRLLVNYRVDPDVARTLLPVEVEISDSLPRSRLFADVEDASQFFQQGSVGYSATSDPTRFDGLELRTSAWSVAPVTVLHARSSFFEDETRVPEGSAALDCALLMRHVPVSWFAQPSLHGAPTSDQPAPAR